jgi:glycosyltransferase involved in cell wall biosynthesis
VAAVSRQLLAAVDPDRVQLTPVVTMAGGGRPAKAVQAVRALRELDRLAPAVVHVHIADGASLVRKSLLLQAMRSGPAIVAHLHFADVAEAVRSPAWDAVAHRADRVLALSQPMADVVPIPPGGSIEVLPNAVDLARFSPRDGPEPPRLSILHVGGDDPRKGLAELIEAHGGLPHAPLLRAAGPSSGRPPPEGPAVEVVGLLPGAGLIDAYRGASVVCFPSRAEGSPMALLEAMACGCAIVATSVGGIVEMVGDAAVVVPPQRPRELRAALESLLADPRRRAELGRRARARVERWFSLDAQVERLITLWTELAAARAAVSPVGGTPGPGA